MLPHGQSKMPANGGVTAIGSYQQACFKEPRSVADSHFQSDLLPSDPNPEQPRRTQHLHPGHPIPDDLTEQPR